MIVQHTMEPLLKDISEIRAPHQDNYFGPNGVCIREVPLYNIFSYQEHFIDRALIIMHMYSVKTFRLLQPQF